MRALADFCYRRRRYVLLTWIALLAGLFAAFVLYQGEYKTEFALPGSESQEAVDLLKKQDQTERTGFLGQIVFTAEQGVDDPEVRSAIEDFLARIEQDVDDVEVVSPYDPANEHQVNGDRSTAYAEVNIGDRRGEEYTDAADTIKDLKEQIQIDGLRVELGGFIFAEQPAFSSEFVGIAAAVIILIIAFGSLLAMGLPIGTALFGVFSGSALIGLATNVIDVPEFTTAMAAMIGIGVGIDYALLIVTRYRQAIHDVLEPGPAVRLSIETSGRAVLFAGLVVVIALAGMFAINLEFVRSVAIGAIIAVFMTMLASLTLLPAMLGFVGNNIDKPTLDDLTGFPGRIFRSNVSIRMRLVALVATVVLLPLFVLASLIGGVRVLFRRIRPRTPKHEQVESSSFWYRWSRLIQHNPWPALVLSAAVLLALATPVLWLRLGFGDAGNLPKSDTTRQAFDLLSEGFGPGFNAPILVVADTPNADDRAKLEELQRELEDTEGVASVTPPSPLAGGAIHIMNVYPTTAPQDEETAQLVDRIRADVIPNVITTETPDVLLTGDPPFLVDFSEYIGSRLPIFIGAVLVLSFLLLTVVFKSIVVALKAVIMNMLSIAASFGLLVTVFQWGIGDNLIGLGREGPIDAWVPMMLFAVVFGLSMDYEVFLLTRVREEYDRTGDNAQAVADGLATTGRVITAAAAIMVCVFGAFVLGESRDLKLLGFGLASAIFIDATLVRMVLVPAAMELMGKWNWYLPSWLDWLPDLRVEARGAPPASGRMARPAGGGD